MTRIALSALILLPLAACGGEQNPEPKHDIPPAVIVAPQPQAMNRQAIDTAAWASPADATTRAPQVLRAQVLLDRARFSPGVIDGVQGENLRQAVAAYEESKGLPIDGQLDEQVFAALTGGDAAPVLTDYVIAAEDVKGPFAPGPIPDDVEAMARLKALDFTGPDELLAEKFHMTVELLKALNPGADFGRAGTSIVVAAIRPQELPAAVARIEVDKAERAVKAFGADGTLLAFYPATVGSDDRPAPSGTLKVRAVADAPTYTYDPSRLTYGPGKTKVTVPPGPNSPVGTVWIDLSKDTFGIHGSDEPKEIGKKFSHGCVRLTNWDAEQLAAGVKPGVPVVFVG